MFSRVTDQDVLFFTKHLSMMLGSGVPIAEALDTLQGQVKPAFQKVLARVYKSVENGQSLANALGRESKYFSDFYINLIAVGDKSGTLDETMKFLAEQLTKDNALRKKVKGAMLYPAIIVSATLIMGGFIAVFILPKLTVFFDDLDTELPLPTKILLFISNAIQNYGIFVLAGIVALGVGSVLSLRHPKIKPIWHRGILSIPMIGAFLVDAQSARFTRSLGTLLKSGVPVIDALDTTAKTASNLTFRNDLMEIKKSVDKGSKISVAMEKKKYKSFPAIVAKMISVGERTGKLDETLLYLSSYYEEEVDIKSKSLATIIEPVLLIFIGLSVGFLALAIISPIYELTGSI